MSRFRSPVTRLVAAIVLTTTIPALADVQPHGGLLRYPDVSGTHIVFVYANDLWTVPRDGGLATPLASPPGEETFPRFSPDGQTIGFVGNYDGNRDLYSIPIDGGVPHRVTHHPSSETLSDWTPDGRMIFFTFQMGRYPRAAELFTVGPEGGLPAKLPVPYGTNGAVSPDGAWLAYTPHTRDHRTWKRYRGGMATDIWLFNLKDHSSKRITDWEGTDSQPMWHGTTVYYLSDQGTSHRLNIWAYDTGTGQRRQVTDFEDFDVKWPSMGPGPSGAGEIVFQSGSDIHLLDLATEKHRPVKVTIPGDRPTIRKKDVNVAGNLGGWDVSSTGKRAVFEARGDIWTVPAKHGSPRNLTRTSGSAERRPSWSPDGRWIAFFCDKSGEYELYVTQSDGRGETRRLTQDGGRFRTRMDWSPDSKWIAFSNKAGEFFLADVASGETKLFDSDARAGSPRMSWSKDSKWIAYGKSSDNQLSAVWLYDVDEGKVQQVTSGRFGDSWPTFDRAGDYLYFASNRNWTSPTYEDLGTTFVYADTDVLLVVPLRDELGSPWAPKVDEETWQDDKDKAKDDEAADEEEAAEKDGGEKSEDAKSDEKKDDAKADDGDEDGDEDEDEKEEEEPIEIELDGFERRAVLLPIDKGSFYNLNVNDEGKLLYVRGAPRGSGREPAIKFFDVTDEKKEEKTVLDGSGAYQMSGDGKKLLVAKGGSFAVVDAKPDQKMEDTLSLSSMAIEIDPREEWKQLFLEAWRIQRDYFYDPNMHGVDWNAVRAHYEKMVADCVTREDVGFVIREMIAELNVGHAYYGGGDVESQPQRSVGMLGADYELHEGAYRISKIYEGAAWDADARGPLSQPGVNVEEGNYLLAVDGVPLDASRDPWAAFQGMAGQTVTITVSQRPKLMTPDERKAQDEAKKKHEEDKKEKKDKKDDDANGPAASAPAEPGGDDFEEIERDVVVTLIGGEYGLRFRAWVEANRRYVEEQTGGRVGYVYVPDTGVNGQNELFRQFFGQIDKAALIVDERWNGGGQIPTRFIELLNRPRTNYWAVRDGKDWAWPPDSHQGPKCMLINGLSGSGGDCFPYYFRQAGLGKLIGTRTWGGLVGISGNPRLIDGAFITSPTFAFYETDGTWGVEGHGVDADIEVIDDPAEMVAGGDPQLDVAIAHMLEELETHPYTPPQRPKYPDRSGMGIQEEDK